MTRLAASLASKDPQAIMDHHAKSFSWAARFLSAPARRDAALLYAYARTADDFADEEHLGTLSQRTEALQALRQQALETIDFGDRLPNPSLAHQTGCMLRRHGVPNIVLATLMDSLQTDAGARQIDSTESLLFFAYGVAGTVGQMMRPLLGAPPAADPHAIALGVAMQLTNISRDVVEDAQRGRCYIPAQWGVTMRIMSAPQNAAEKNEAFAALQRLLALADDFYAYAYTGFSAIPRHNLRAIRVAAALYQGIGHKILQRGAHCYWQGRVSLNRFEKIKLLTQTLIAPFDQGAENVRDVWRDDLLHLVGLPGLPATES